MQHLIIILFVHIFGLNNVSNLSQLMQSNSNIGANVRIFLDFGTAWTTQYRSSVSGHSVEPYFKCCAFTSFLFAHSRSLFSLQRN